MEKTCTRCLTTKPIDAFHKDASRASGVFPQCRDCCRSAKKARHNPDRPKTVGEKKCSRCRVVKPASQFHRDKSRLDGCSSYCKPCVRTHVNNFYRRNPDGFKDRASLRKARKRAATVETVSRREVYRRGGGRCYMCLEPIAFEDMHLEHATPLSRGGSHSYQNCRPSCESCNLSKGAKTFEEVARG